MFNILSIVCMGYMIVVAGSNTVYMACGDVAWHGLGRDGTLPTGWVHSNGPANVKSAGPFFSGRVEALQGPLRVFWSPE